MTPNIIISPEEELKMIRHVTLVGFWINAALVIIKLFFGYWGNSDALVADGYHSLSDFLTDFMVLYFVGISYKKADREHPYGHGKFETVASVMIAAILLIVAIGIGWGGVDTIVNSMKGLQIPRPDVWTIVVAAVSILSKEWCYRYTMRYANRFGSSALKANAWHHRTDAVSSIATLIGVSLSFALGEEWRILDPIASVIIAVLIGISAIQIAKPSVNELLEISLPADEIERIRAKIKGVSGVMRVHNLRGRKNGHTCIIDVNIHVDPDITVRLGHAITQEVEKTLKEDLGDDTIIYVHMEPQESL